MRKFRFIGTQQQAEEYAYTIPIFGKVYNGDDNLGGYLIDNVEKFATYYPVSKKEWEEVFENQSASTKEERIKLVYTLMGELGITLNDMYEHIR